VLRHRKGFGMFDSVRYGWHVGQHEAFTHDSNMNHERSIGFASKVGRETRERFFARNRRLDT
jgi:hypothetical protein